MNILLEFSSKKNIDLLWDILLDELNIKTNNNLTLQIRTIFEANIKPFVSKANPNKNLINLNKDFLSQILIALNKLNQNFKKINISNEELNIAYKIEDIQSYRQNEFEKDLLNKQKEFDNIINPPKPKELDFSIKEKENKITEMEKLIKETIATRNYDIEQLTNNNTKINPNTNININELLNLNEKDNKKKVKWDEKLISNENETDNIQYVDNYNYDYNNNINNNITDISIQSQIININNEIVNINQKFEILFQMIHKLDKNNELKSFSD
jgi:hypothetical protein